MLKIKELLGAIKNISLICYNFNAGQTFFLLHNHTALASQKVDEKIQQTLDK